MSEGEEMLIAVCEDLREEQKTMERMLDVCWERRGIKGRVCTYQDGEHLIVDAVKVMFDIVFMDIYMPGMGGIRAAKAVKRLLPACEIVFVTVSRDFALEAYAIGAVHYLVKPVSPENIGEAIDRCCAKKNVKWEGKIVEIIADRRKIPINQNCIRYIESQGKMLKIHTDAGEYHTWMTLGSIQKDLDEKRFLKLQRSYIANMSYIAAIKNDCCILKDGVTIAVSRRHGNKIKETYHQFLFAFVMEEL